MQTSKSSEPPCRAAAEVLARLTLPTVDPTPRPRLLALFAHPDDEVLAVGARLDHLHGSLFLTATDGAPTDGFDAHHHGFDSLTDYRTARRAELCAALAGPAAHNFSRTSSRPCQRSERDPRQAGRATPRWPDARSDPRAPRLRS